MVHSRAQNLKILTPVTTSFSSSWSYFLCALVLTGLSCSSLRLGGSQVPQASLKLTSSQGWPWTDDLLVSTSWEWDHRLVPPHLFIWHWNLKPGTSRPVTATASTVHCKWGGIHTPGQYWAWTPDVNSNLRLTLTVGGTWGELLPSSVPQFFIYKMDEMALRSLFMKFRHWRGWGRRSAMSSQTNWGYIMSSSPVWARVRLRMKSQIIK